MRPEAALFLPCFLIAGAASAAAQVDLEIRATESGKPSAGLGFAVAIDGDVAVVGAPREDRSGNSQAGAAYVYRLHDRGWALEQELTPAEEPWASELFGYSVDVEGDVIVVGSPGDRPFDTPAWRGAVHVFRFDGVSWKEEAKLEADGEHVFGWKVAVRVPLLVATSADREYAQLFGHDGAKWNKKRRLRGDATAELFGSAVEFQGNRIAIGAPGEEVTHPGQGAVYTFAPGPTGWEREAKILSSKPESHVYFGFSLALDGERLLIGAFAEPVGGVLGAGAATLFRHDASGWSERARFTSSDPTPEAWFGQTAELQGDEILIGAPGIYGDPKEGIVERWREIGGTWQRRQTMTGAHESGFGSSLARDGCAVLIGAAIGADPYRGDVHLAVVPKLGLAAEPGVVSAGDALEFLAGGGTAAGPLLLALVEVSGVPLFTPLVVDSFDAHCEWSTTAVVPPGLAGLVLEFQAFGPARWSRKRSSDRIAVTFQ